MSENTDKQYRVINGSKYIIGDPEVKNSGECYEIGGRFYRDTDYIAYDHRISRYVLNNKDSILYGVIDVDGEDLKFGNFSKIRGFSKYSKILDKNGEVHLLMSPRQILDSIYYYEDDRNNLYVHRLYIHTSSIVLKKQISHEDRNRYAYNTSNLGSEWSRTYKALQRTIEVSDPVKIYSKVLEDFTFGVEFETYRGKLSTSTYKSLGLTPLRDGSIGGYEYATVPLKGPKGLQTIIDALKVLKRKTTYNKDCSLHIHIGGMPRTKEFILAFYKVMDAIQGDFFNMYSVYKMKNFGYKRKSYTKPLPSYISRRLSNTINKDNINRNFNYLFEYLSGGTPFNTFGSDLNRVMNHPLDPENNRKWQINPRYHFINIIPLIFTNKSTVEFRIHNSTYNVNQFIGYLMLCNAIIRYTMIYQKDILRDDSIIYNRRFSLNRIIDKIYGNLYDEPKLRADVSNYIHNRTSIVNSQTLRNGIAIPDKYFEDDNYSYYIDWDKAKFNYNETRLNKKSVTVKKSIDSTWSASYAPEPVRSSGLRDQIREEDRVINTISAEQLGEARRALEEHLRAFSERSGTESMFGSHMMETPRDLEDE